MNLHIHLEELENPEPLRRDCTQRAEELQAEFPEITRVEVTIHRVGPRYETHVHVTGKEFNLAARARTSDLHQSLSDATEKARRQLRKHHDKQIFVRRRAAQRDASRVSRK